MSAPSASEWPLGRVTVLGAHILDVLGRPVEAIPPGQGSVRWLPRAWARTPGSRTCPTPFHGADKVLGYGLALAALWYFGGLLWRLRKGTAGVKPVEDLVDPNANT
jgi:hypothetical protein